MVLSQVGASLSSIGVALFEVGVAPAIGCIRRQFFLVAIFLAARSVRIGTVNEHVKYFAHQ